MEIISKHSNLRFGWSSRLITSFWTNDSAPTHGTTQFNCPVPVKSGFLSLRATTPWRTIADIFAPSRNGRGTCIDSARGHLERTRTLRRMWNHRITPPHPKKKDGLFCDIGDCIGLIDRLGVGEGRERVKRETSLFFPPFINADSTTFRSFFLERKHITSFRPDATPQRLSSFFITAAARPSHRTAKTGRAHRSHPQLLIASNRSMKAIWSSFTTSGTDRGGWGKKRHRLDKNKNRKRKSAPGGFTWWRRTKWKRRRRRRR